MLKRFQILFKVGIGYAGCAAIFGLAQATQLTAIANPQKDTSWQNIVGTSYTFNDANHNGQINVGETVTFTVDMHKTYWGVHDFDALKFWIDGPANSNLYTGQFVWDFDPTNANFTEYSRSGYRNPYTGQIDHSDSWKPWKGGDKLFTFDYTFTTAGTYDLTASVMCSADLSGLSGWADGKPTQADWNAWTENVHTLPGWRQGETEKYQLAVIQQPVPEPETYAMMVAGLGLIGFSARRRKTYY